MMLGLHDLLNAGSQFEDTPLTAADFQFSNALEAVDPTTGLPPVPAVAISPSVVSTVASSGAGLGGGWLLLISGALAAWYYWPQIKAEVARA
jgi:hypothetical protein